MKPSPVRGHGAEYRTAFTLDEFRGEVGRSIDYTQAMHVPVQILTPFGEFEINAGSSFEYQLLRWRAAYDRAVSCQCDDEEFSQ